MKSKVKVGNITNLSDARYCAGMGVDWLGFNVDTIGLKTFEDITGWVTGPSFVIEVNPDTALEQLNQYQPDAVELPISRLSAIGQFTFSTIFVSLSMQDWLNRKNELIALQGKVSMLVLTQGLADEQQENDLLNELSNYFEVLIGFPAAADRIPENLLHKVGYNLQGSDEVRPGLKDYQSLSDILEKLEVD